MAIKMEQKPMTRGDEIRAQVADNQGLARFIIRIRSPYEPRFFPACPECYADMMSALDHDDGSACFHCLEQWLGQEVRPTDEPGGEPNG